jgi:DNA-binding MarR family transcriptional regulator
MGNSLTVQFSDLVLQFLRQHFTRLHSLSEEIGVYRGQPPLLRTIADNEGCAQSLLSEQLHLTPATVTRMLQRMQHAGLLERRPDPEDQRVTRVYLTPAGHAIQGAILQRMQQVSDEMLAGFSEQEQEQLSSYLARMRDNLMKVNRENLD